MSYKENRIVSKIFGIARREQDLQHNQGEGADGNEEPNPL